MMRNCLPYALACALGFSSFSVGAAPANSLLSSPAVVFPSVVPIEVGSGLSFGGFQFSNAKLLDANIVPSVGLDGPPFTISAEWGFTRLACTVQCIGGAQDSDPMFMLAVGSKLYGFMLADDGGGTVFATTSDDGGAYVSNVRSQHLASGVGSNEVGNSALLAVSYTVGSDFVTAEGSINGVAFSQTWGGGANSFESLSLVFVADNDTGERYLLDSFQSVPAIPVPEPTAATLLALGLAIIALPRARK